MKNRLLPFTIVVLTVGFAALLISASITDDKKKSAPVSSHEYLDVLRVNQHTGSIAVDDVLRARKQAILNKQIAAGREYNFDWMLRGPNNMGGRTRALIFDNKDQSGLTLYAGSVMGGMFRSTNGGITWEKINAENGNLRVTCIAQTSDGDIFAGTGEGFMVEEHTVLGEWGYTGGFMGQGLFRSTDGETFNLVPSTQPEGENWLFINELAADGGNTLFACTNTGLHFTSNKGESWTTATTAEGEELLGPAHDVKFGPDGLVVAAVNNLCYISDNGDPANFILRSTDSTYDLPNSGVGRLEFAIPPSDGNIIYALVVTTQGALNGVYRSDDRGETWRVVGPGGSTNFNVFNTGSNVSDGEGIYNCALVTFPDDPDKILLGGLDMWLGEKFNDEGFFAWNVASRSFTPPQDPNYLPEGHHAYVFNPANPNEFFTCTNGGINMGTESSGTPNSFIFQNMNRDYIASQFYTIAPTAEKKVLAGGSQGLGTPVIDGTLNPSDAKRGNDIWTNQANVPQRDNGGYVAYSVIYPEAVLYSKYPHPARDGNIELFVRRSEFGGGPDWAANFFDDKYRSDAFLSPFILHEKFDNDLSRDSIQFMANRDYPAGETLWLESNNMNRRFPYVLPADLNQGDSLMIQDPITARFIIGGDDRIVMTLQAIMFDVQDLDWFTISDEGHNGFAGTPQSMDLSGDANHLFVGTLEGQLFRISNIKYAYNYETADVTSPYTVISTSRIPVYLPGTSDEIDQVITSVAVDPNDANNVMITLGNYGNEHYVYMSTNALDENPEFRSIMGDPNNGGLPQAPAYSSLFEMDPNTDLVMIGNEFGIYVSENAEASNPTWIQHNNGMGEVPVMMIKQQKIRKQDDIIPIIDPNGNVTYETVPGNNNFGVIYAATHGRGLITLDEFQKPVGVNEMPSSGTTQDLLNVFPNPAINRAFVEVELTGSAEVTINIFDLRGQVIRTIDKGNAPEGKHVFEIGSQNMAPGTYVLQLRSGSISRTAKFIVY